MSWCLLLTGMPNSGKSTIAYQLVQKEVRNALVIDGDKHREMQFLGRKLGFTKEDVLANNEHVIKLAQFAQEQGFNVIIAQIAPYLEQRMQMRKRLKRFFSVYCECYKDIRRNRPNFVDTELLYEPGDFNLVVDTGITYLEKCVENILGAMLWGDK